MMEHATVVGIGTFDGVHLGHQAILAEMRRQAARRGTACVAHAFQTPPRLHARGAADRLLLLPEPIKVRLLLRSVDRVVRASFSALRDRSPAQFAEEVLAAELHAQSVIVGPSFRFGARRSGDPEALRSLGERLGFTVTVLPPLLVDGRPVSSTRIRSCLSAGDVAAAARLLGRPPTLFGRVTTGDRFGHALGYPTANLSIDPHVLLPQDGVYAGHAFVDPADGAVGRPALIYVGSRPTLGQTDGAPRCEVHLLSPPEDALYGRDVEVQLSARLRGDRAFPSLDALGRQIGRDVERARETLNRLAGPATPISG